jgi:hypothetical protein
MGEFETSAAEAVRRDHVRTCFEVAPRDVRNVLGVFHVPKFWAFAGLHALPGQERPPRPVRYQNPLCLDILSNGFHWLTLAVHHPLFTHLDAHPRTRRAPKKTSFFAGITVRTQRKTSNQQTEIRPTHMSGQFWSFS